ncbi:MAG: hypothetical protein ACR2PF_06630 [Rhizobiaceae bacterium]
MVAELSRKSALKLIVAADLPDRHPVRLLRDIYQREQRGNQFDLPDYETFVGDRAPELLDFCLVLEPVQGDPYLDFTVQSKGRQIPGIETAEIAPGELYTQRVAEEFAQERLMELASCIVLKNYRLTKANSARRSSLNVKVYRGVFPVWQVARKRSAAILMIAPRYVEL